MREIKFRSKRKDNDRWVYGSLLRDGDGKNYIVDALYGECTACSVCGKQEMDIYEVDPKTVGQYTGLKDKNDIEMYEGDIISAYNGRIKGPVIFDKRGLAFGVPNGPNEIYQFSMNFLESKDIKVIGNIYENQEILD